MSVRLIKDTSGEAQNKVASLGVTGLSLAADTYWTLSQFYSHKEQHKPPTLGLSSIFQEAYGSGDHETEAKITMNTLMALLLLQTFN